ncbi:MAG TPA: hypothetical protein VF546_04940 [Pyrinomonadaceae bacterium]|jgi:hypothetical protein
MANPRKTAQKTNSGKFVMQPQTAARRTAVGAPAPVGTGGVAEIEIFAGDMEQQAALYFKWAAKEIKASRVRSERAGRRAERLSRETDAVLARLKTAR